jgi:very-short-patch-repair endonuclease
MPSIFSRNCNRCGEHYRGTGRKFCSDRCRTAASSRRVDLVCGNCGKHFDNPASRHHGKFCSAACWRLFSPGKGLTCSVKRIAVSCKTCRKECLIVPSRAGVFRFCSKACMDSIGARINGYGPRVPRLSVACIVCGRSFKTLACKQKGGRGRTCSTSCRAYYSNSVQTKTRSSGIEGRFFDDCIAAGAVINRQVKIGPYSVDAAARCAPVAFEFDGTYWHSSARAAKHDHQKDHFLRMRGLRVIRIPEALYKSDPSRAIGLVVSASQLGGN